MCVSRLFAHSPGDYADAVPFQIDDILLAEDDSTIRAMKFIWEREFVSIQVNMDQSTDHWL